MNLALIIGLAIALTSAIGCGIERSEGKSVDLRGIAPAVDLAPKTEVQGDLQTAIFAGGCFWGVEAVFEHTKGVIDVKSGYAGGDAKSANYEKVSAGETDHAEAVLITYDPSQISYSQLLTIFFSVAHNPTELNRQGPDVGRHYRSAIFFINEEQRKASLNYIESIEKSKAFAKPVATEVVPLVKFYDAEGYHQDYMKKNPKQPYIVAHDLPKLDDLKAKFPELYVAKYVK